MRWWTVGRRIAGGYAVLLVLLAIVAGVATYGLTDARSTFRSAIRIEEQRIVPAFEVSADTNSAVALLYRFAIGGEEEFVPESLESLADALQQARQLRDTSPTAELRTGWGEAVGLLEKIESDGEAAIAARKVGDEAGAERILQERVFPARDQQRPLLRRLVESERASAARAAKSASDTVSRAFWVVLVVAIVALVFGIAIAWLLARGITRRLRSAIATLGSASVEILAATAEQAAGVAEEGTAVQETSTTVQEVTQTAQLAAEKAQTVAKSVQRTAEISAEGKEAVEESVGGARQARDRMQAVAEHVLALSEQAQSIGEITSTVNDLAEQSNLLAVNAGIEAAKAGEAGRGFAVVAAEVRALAEQSKQAAAEIRALLVEIQRATQAAVMSAEQGMKAVEAGEAVTTRAGEAIRLLSESLTESAQSAQQILVSSQQQMAGMDQVTLAINNIQQASAQTAASSQQVEQAARNLNELAQELAALVAASSDRQRNGRGAG